MTPEQVAENQTRRILAALRDLVAERGYERVSVRMVTDRSGVSRRTFYDLRGGLEPWFVLLCDAIAGRLRARIDVATEHGSTPAERTRAAAGALIAFCREDPAAARICFVETLAAGDSARAWRDVLIEDVTGRIAVAAERPGTELAARAAVGAVVELAARDPGRDGLDLDRAAALVETLMTFRDPEVASAR